MGGSSSHIDLHMVDFEQISLSSQAVKARWQCSQRFLRNLVLLVLPPQPFPLVIFPSCQRNVCCLTRAKVNRFFSSRWTGTQSKYYRTYNVRSTSAEETRKKERVSGRLGRGACPTCNPDSASWAPAPSRARTDCKKLEVISAMVGYWIGSRS